MMKSDVIENRMNLSNHRNSIPASKLVQGSTQDKYPVILDNGKTIIFISDKSQEAEIRFRYNSRRK
jgi:Tol biopolymer transport system component